MRRAGAVVAIALCTGLAIQLSGPATASPRSAPSPLHASQVPRDVRPMDPAPGTLPDGIPRSCLGEYLVNLQRGTDVTAARPGGHLVFDGVRVPLTPIGLLRAAELGPPDASWRQWLHALVWLLPLALDRPARAVQLALLHARTLPDPGSGATTDITQSTGWTSGTIRNRLEVISCLYRMTDDRRLLPIGRALGDTLLDDRRYPGRPLSEPHNHGILTNRAMIQAARVFDRPEWHRVSYQRLRRDLPGVFSPCGMVYEQSTGYHALNVSLWSAFPELAAAELRPARAALAALIRPDGVLEQIGNGQARVGVPSGARLWCPSTGWAANTVGGMHYILRFGPPTSGHGHADHGAPTWFTAGVPVLSDRGLYDKVEGPRRDFATGLSGHSVLEPVGVDGFAPSTQGSRTGPDSYALRDSSMGIQRTRTLSFERRALTVKDTARSMRSGAVGQEWIQHWHLAPGWRPTSSGARHTSGVRLDVDCRGGRLVPVRVSAFPSKRKAVPAWDLQCRATGSSVELTTTLTIR